MAGGTNALVAIFPLLIICWLVYRVFGPKKPKTPPTQPSATEPNQRTIQLITAQQKQIELVQQEILGLTSHNEAAASLTDILEKRITELEAALRQTQTLLRDLAQRIPK